MRRLIFIVVMMVLATGWYHTSQAQSPTQNNAPPTIIFFESENEAVSMEELEHNQAEVRVSWQVVGLQSPFELRLEQYYFNEWQSVLDDNESPSATDERDVILNHPVNFGRPTLRLRIVDDEETIDMQFITFDYEVDDDTTPSIVAFDTNTPALSRDRFDNNTAWVSVWWDVSGRQPHTNLIFEQVMSDGEIISIEAPRLALWVSSTGGGNLWPVIDEESIGIQLRIVDMRSGETYDTAEITVLITEPPTDSGPTSSPPTSTPTTGNGITFTLPTEPINRLEPFQIGWDVPNGTNVTIRLLSYDYRISRWLPYFEGEISDLSAAGTREVMVPDTIRQGSIRYRLEAQQNGQDVQVDSDEVQLICYPIFHADGCSTFAPQTTEAIFQTYENGVIIWRQDSREFMVLYEYDNTQRVGWSEFADTWTTSDGGDFGLTPPDGLIAPTDRFGKLWTEHEDVEILGWATAAPQTYTMQYQTVLGSSASFDAIHITLPDGTILNLVTASYENGGPAWMVIE